MKGLSGIMLIGVGVLLLLGNFGLLPENFALMKLWPVLIVVWGVRRIAAAYSKRATADS